MNIRTIRTRCEYGQWFAIDDDSYAGPGSPQGWGATEQEAIDDLLEQMEERK